jgi:hypothetical protein
MPILHFFSDLPLSPGERKTLLAAATSSIAPLLGKHPDRLMALYTPSEIVYGNPEQPSMYIEVQHIVTTGISLRKSICMFLFQAVRSVFQVDESRICIQFTVPGEGCAWRIANGEAECAEPGCGAGGAR